MTMMSHMSATPVEPDFDSVLELGRWKEWHKHRLGGKFPLSYVQKVMPFGYTASLFSEIVAFRCPIRH